MAGHNAYVGEFTARDAAKAGVLWKDLYLNLFDFRKQSDGTILTAATAPAIVVAGSANMIRWVAGTATPPTITFTVPADYNETSDKAHLLLLLVKSTAGDAGILMTPSVAINRTGSAVSVGVSLLTGTAISDATALLSTCDLVLSGNGIKGKDSLTVSIAPDAHATAVIDMYAATFRYIGGTSLYSETDRYATS